MNVEKYGDKIVPYYEISTTDNFGDSVDRDSPSNCEVILSEDSDELVKNPSEQTLICILDVLEYDLLVKGLHIKYNFPHGMCDYVEVSLPWHFNYPITGARETKACRKRNPKNDETKYCKTPRYDCNAKDSLSVSCGGQTTCKNWNRDCQKEADKSQQKHCDSSLCGPGLPSNSDNFVNCGGSNYCDWDKHCQDTEAPNLPEIKFCNPSLCPSVIRENSVDCGGSNHCDWDSACQASSSSSHSLRCIKPPQYDLRYCVKPAEFTQQCTNLAYDDGECLASISGLCPDSDCQVFKDDKKAQTEFRCPSDKRGKAGRSKYPRCCVGGADPNKDDSPFVPDKECYGGSALIASGDYKSTVATLSTIEIKESKEGGSNDTITIPSLVSVNKGFAINGVGLSTPVANYLEVLDVPPDDAEIDRSSLPDFLQICGNCPNQEPRPFFEFECFDQAGETLHLIQLMIREWNTLEEFRDFYNDGGNDDADPDVEGIEGEDCDYETFARLGSGPAQCNDLLDFDDLDQCDPDLYKGLCLQVSDGYPRALYSEPNKAEDKPPNNTKTTINADGSVTIETNPQQTPSETPTE